ncbi:alpha/beta hydrolase [soil metagenome]
MRVYVWLRRLIRTSVVLVILYLALSPRMLPGLYTHKLFHPDKERGTQFDIDRLNSYKAFPNQAFLFKAVDSSNLRGWIFRASDSASRFHPSRIFLVCPGNAGDIPKRLEFIKLLLSTGASVFTYEPRGFGKSEGVPTIANICEDGSSAYDYLVNVLGYQADQIVIYGISLGTTVACHVSSVRRAKALILQSGFASLPRIAHEKVPFLKIYPAWLFPQRPALNNVAILEQPHVPLLIMHGAVDSIIDIDHSREMFSRALAPKRFVVCPRSSHVNIDPADVEIFTSAIKQFLAQLN